MSRLVRRIRQTVFDAIVVGVMLIGPVMVHRILFQPKLPPLEPLPPDFDVGLGDEVEAFLREQRGSRPGWPH